MLHILFGGLMGMALLWGLIQGEGERVVSAVLSGAEDGITTALSLAGGFAFFCGMMEILARAGGMEWMKRRAAPCLRILLGKSLPDEALSPVAMNLAANLLGLGNAATPMGIEAARRMAQGDTASNALCMFLVINASSVQLMPTTVIALRAAAGSASPGSITGPTLLATLFSTMIGILSCKLLEGRA